MRLKEQLAAVRSVNPQCRFVYREAHSIKGAAAEICAGPLSEVALELERVGKAGDLDQANFLLPGLKQQFERVKNEVA